MSAPLFESFRQLALFQGLADSDVEKFLRECQEEAHPPDTVLFREGDEPQSFYVLIDGEVEIWKDYGTNFADILAVRGPGACFGELSLIDELPRSATVKTKTPARLLTLEMPHFRRIIEGNPTVAMMIMKTVSHMVRVSNETFQNGLRQKNLMLEAAYRELKAAHESLIRAERLSTLGKFASMIIHDLRNPLSVVKGYAELLCFPTQDTERTVFLATKLLAETDRLNRMVGELLDYSRGEIRLNWGPVRFTELFRRLGDEFRPVLESRGIQLQIDASSDPSVMGDLDRLHRVLTNLMDNARKAMASGGTLTLQATTEEESIVVQVSDTGEGMDDETRDKLFEPFFSASQAGGTGLGMLVVQNVVEAHRGVIEVESRLGQGTVIRLVFPAKMEQR